MVMSDVISLFFPFPISFPAANVPKMERALGPSAIFERKVAAAIQSSRVNQLAASEPIRRVKTQKLAVKRRSNP